MRRWTRDEDDIKEIKGLLIFTLIVVVAALVFLVCHYC